MVELYNLILYIRYNNFNNIFMQSYHLHSLSETDVSLLSENIKIIIQDELSFQDNLIELLFFKPDVFQVNSPIISPAYKWCNGISLVELLDNNIFLSLKQSLNIRHSYISKIITKESFVFDQDHHRKLNTFGKFIIGTLLDLSESLSKTQFQFDVLTGSINRRAFESILLKELGEVRRRIKTSSIAFIDIDDFKHVNDTFGHDAGDEVLIKMVDIFTLELRSYDVISRWGGEEFIILLSESKLEASESICSRVSNMLRAHTFTFNSTSITITASIGLTQIKPSDTVHDLINRADKLMYLSKQSGKDRITSD